MRILYEKYHSLIVQPHHRSFYSLDFVFTKVMYFIGTNLKAFLNYLRLLSCSVITIDLLNIVIVISIIFPIDSILIPFILPINHILTTFVFIRLLNFIHIYYLQLVN